MNFKKHSLILEFTGIFLFGVLAIVLLVSVIFVSAFRSLSYREIESRIITNAKRLRAQVEAQMQERVDLLYYTGMGALPMITADIMNEQALEIYFRTMTKTKEDVQLLFCCSPGLWNGPGGFIVFGDGWKPAEDYDNRVRSWWADAVAANGKTIFTDPYVDLITNQLVVTLSRLMYNDQGQPVAVMGEDISMGKLDSMANNFLETAGMQSFFLHQSGKYITNPDSKAIMQDDFFTDYGLETVREDMLDSSYFFNNGNMIICSEPITMTGWTLVSLLPAASVFANVNRVILRVIIIEVCSILAFMVLLVLIIRKMIKPVTVVTKELKAISEGEGDLTRYITVKSSNEIGALTRYFNHTLEKIKEMILAIKKQTGILAGTGEDLSNNMTETVAAINQINANIMSIMGSVKNQNIHITETYTSMEQIRANMEKLNSYVKNQAGQVGESGVAIEKMIASIQSVVSTLEKNKESMQDLLGDSETGRNGILEVTGDIQEIAKESEGLLEINAVMENIASQTNLLSMNAAIEAAHAGEAGKGFAVVADEIRKLAESSAEQSKTISGVLKKIRTSIDKIVKSADNVFQKFDAIENDIQIVSEQVSNIRYAMDEQNVEGKKILNIISSLDAITCQVKNSSIEMLEEGQQIVNGSRQLESLTLEITKGMNEIVIGADRISITANQTNQISGQNKENVDLLTKEVSRFKV